MAQPRGREVRGIRGQAAQHVGGLARRLAGARGLDRQHLLEVVHHLGDGGVAVGGLLGGRALDCGGQSGRRLGAAALDVWQRLLDVLHRDGHLGVRPERHLSGQHLVEDDPQRVDVGLLGHVVAERLLGRDVVGRAQHPAGGGQALSLHRARDPEVGHLGPPVAIDQHVLRLDVPVHELVQVRALERPPDLDRVGHGLRDGQPAEAPDALLERLALHVLEDDVGRAVVLAGVDHGDHVGMVHLRHGARLAPKALELVRVARHVPVHELDRHMALERGVEGAIDAGHPARTDDLLEPEAVAYECPDHRHLFCALTCPYAFAISQTRPVRPRGPPSPRFAGSYRSSAKRCGSPT